MPRGGRRPGAGRPRNSGKFAEKTKAVRIPESIVDQVLDYAMHRGYRLPLFQSCVAAGLPAPASDDIEESLDLNSHLIRNPETTFYVRVTGDSMINAGIDDGDLLVVDRGLKPCDGKVVVAAVNGELTVKRLRITGTNVQLVAENPRYPPLVLQEGEDLHIWGVVTNVIHGVS